MHSKADTFLDSIGRNSKNSKHAYSIALRHFEGFLSQHKYTLDSIIPLLTKGKINVYELLDQFITYLSHRKIAVTSLKLYVAAVRSYLEYQDVDISISKFKRRVKMPKLYKDAEEPLTIQDIRKLLEYCTNARLKCYLLVLISSGLRPIEAASLRLMDLDNNSKILPAKVTVRKEYSKTKRSRIVYISDEAATHLQTLLKYRKNELQQDTLIFSVQKDSKSPATIYFKLLQQFTVLQRKAGLDQRKEGSRRHKITLHSFRRTCFSIITQQTNSEFANYILGHTNSPYWTHTEQERREIYRTKCMPQLTILDYSALDVRSRNLEEQLSEMQSELNEYKEDARRRDERARKQEEEWQKTWARLERMVQSDKLQKQQEQE